MGGYKEGGGIQLHFQEIILSVKKEEEPI